MSFIDKIQKQPALKPSVSILENSNKKQVINRASNLIWAIVRLILLIGLSYIVLYPIIFCLSLSIRQPNDMIDPTVIWLPKNLTFDNIKFVLENIGFPEAFGKSMAISLSCSFLQMMSCAITGYGFARFKFKGRNIIFLLALMTFIVPPQIISMPLYIQYSKITITTSQLFGGDGIQLINTVTPIALAAVFAQGIKSGLFIYLFRQSYKGMPKELEDAAYLDGCGPIKAFTTIMFPNSTPILLVTFVLSFVWYWNDYINISLFFNKSKPLSVLLASVTDMFGRMISPAGGGYTSIEVTVYETTFCLMFILLPIILYVFLQKKFTESLMSTSIVG
ncbi:MAG: carbohydrate ABC transporter permease [Clostridia bacterium]|nr:carbohydrate ABC transporter permease [Clostridia bacterium]